MTKTHPRQLELPVMVDVNGKAQVSAMNGRKAASCARSIDTGFHKPASAADQAIYKDISDNYFNTTAKQV